MTKIKQYDDEFKNSPVVPHLQTLFFLVLVSKKSNL